MTFMMRSVAALGLMLALAAVVEANPPQYPANPVTMPPSAGPEQPGRVFGLAPWLKRSFHITGYGPFGMGDPNSASGCNSGCGGKCKPGVAGPPTQGPPNGTLVFPVNPFMRSPRDFFMEDR